MDINGFRGRGRGGMNSDRALLLSAVGVVPWFTIWFVMGTHDPLRLVSRVSLAMEICIICVHQCFIIYECASVI